MAEPDPKFSVPARVRKGAPSVLDRRKGPITEAEVIAAMVEAGCPVEDARGRAWLVEAIGKLVEAIGNMRPHVQTHSTKGNHSLQGRAEAACDELRRVLPKLRKSIENTAKKNGRHEAATKELARLDALEAALLPHVPNYRPRGTGWHAFAESLNRATHHAAPHSTQQARIAFIAAVLKRLDYGIITPAAMTKALQRAPVWTNE